MGFTSVTSRPLSHPGLNVPNWSLLFLWKLFLCFGLLDFQFAFQLFDWGAEEEDTIHKA